MKINEETFDKIDYQLEKLVWLVQLVFSTIFVYRVIKIQNNGKNK